MKVLLALEQTRISEGAIRILSRMTLPGGSDLFLLYVNPLSQQIMGLAKKRDAKISQQVQDVQKNVLEQARQFLDKVENRFNQQKVNCISMVKNGFPGEEILKVIHARDIDLVVLGTRGFSKATGFFLGSVSQGVLQEAPCSVLIARKMPREKKTVRGMKLLLAIDGSPDSQAAVDFVKTVGLTASSHLTILHVVKKHVYETGRTLIADSHHEKELAELAEELLEVRGREGAKLLEQTRKGLSSPGLAIQERLVYGNPAAEILKAARYLEADLIVMGSRGTTGIKRILGSVSNKVAHSAGCPVAIMRSKRRR